MEKDNSYTPPKNGNNKDEEIEILTEETPIKLPNNNNDDDNSNNNNNNNDDDGDDDGEEQKHDQIKIESDLPIIPPSSSDDDKNDDNEKYQKLILGEKGKEKNSLINNNNNSYGSVGTLTNYTSNNEESPNNDNSNNNNNNYQNNENSELESNEIISFSNIEALETEEFGLEGKTRNNEELNHEEFENEDKKNEYLLLENKKQEKTFPKIKTIIKRLFNSFKIGILFIIFVAFTVFFIIEPERNHVKMIAVSFMTPKYVYYDKNSPDTLAKFRTKIPVLELRDQINAINSKNKQKSLKQKKIEKLLSNLNQIMNNNNDEDNNNNNNINNKNKNKKSLKINQKRNNTTTNNKNNLNIEGRFKIIYNLQKYDYSDKIWRNVENQTHSTLVPVLLNNNTIFSKRSGGSSKIGPTKKDSFTFYSPYNSIPESEKDKKMLLRVAIFSSFPFQVIPIEMEMIQNYKIADFDIFFGIFILFIVYILIVFELVHRTIAGMIGAFLVVAVLSILRERPSIKELISWVEFDTIGLLFGMMVMVGIFSGTGFFEFCSLQAYKISRGKIFILTAILCGFTAIVSAFLDNVTTMLLMTPVTINLCKVINISPVPIIISEVIFSNIGGSGTAIGDPPIVIIVNDAGVRANGIGFFDVALYLGPCAIVASILTFPWVRVLYWKVFNQKPVLSDEKMKKEKEIKLWSKTMRKMNNFQNEERIVKQKLKRHIAQLKKQLKFIHQKTNKTDIKKLENDYKIKDWKLFLICSAVLLVVIVAFFTESFLSQWIHLSLAWIALIGAVIMLLLTNTNDMEYVMEKIEWSTLLFFGALFILMEGLDKLGLIGFVGTNTSNLIASIPEKWRLSFAITLLVWVSALVSAFIDNIPYTTAMIPIVLNLAGPPVNLPLKPILWALALGCCFGGNGTLIGASANVVSAGLSESHGYPISFVSFSYLGLPIMFFSVLVANIYLLFIHCVLKIGLS